MKRIKSKGNVHLFQGFFQLKEADFLLPVGKFEPVLMKAGEKMLRRLYRKAFAVRERKRP